MGGSGVGGWGRESFVCRFKTDGKEIVRVTKRRKFSYFSLTPKQSNETFIFELSFPSLSLLRFGRAEGLSLSPLFLSCDFEGLKLSVISNRQFSDLRWCGEIRDVIFSDNGSVTVVYRLTVRGSDGEAFRESSGTISSSDSHIVDPVAAAEEIAFCRACARFGLGLYLYHEE
ncbi:hypothetical protein CsatB_006980 [Cannabis sativa]|uniref:uncharacterized protein LOC133032156 n=1 Tax=Cannabis sativa TaxID=3483 RepID=UPI0029CA8519|nr:uncharacterized protein LOC133032156 [Cannabis sativa]